MPSAAPPVAAELAAGIHAIAYTTIADVEIAHVGMKWRSVSGDQTFTLEHLAAAVEAANGDPHVLAPRLKLAHDDPRFNEDPIVFDAFEYHGIVRSDGNPVYGKVANLRLTNDGGVVMGDYVNVPDWLAASMPSAYPSRSFEGDWDVETPGGKRYSLVLTAVALLGEPLPAISSLEDLAVMLTRGPAALSAHKSKTVKAHRREPMPISAEASVDAVMRQFWTDFAVDDRYWWWPVDVRVDPNQVIADDDEGHLYRVPFETDTDGIAAFGDPVRVVEEFRDVADTSKEPVAAGRIVMRYAEATAARPKNRVRAATNPKEEEMADDAKKTLRETLGLPETATQDEVDAAALEALAKNDPTPVVDKPEPVVEIEKPEATPVAASAITVDPETWAQTQRDAKDGREARAEQVAASRRQFVDEAVKAGKFPPSRRDHYLALMERDDEGTREFVNTLTAGAIPVDERATAPAQAASDEQQLNTVRQHLGLKAAAA